MKPKSERFILKTNALKKEGGLGGKKIIDQQTEGLIKEMEGLENQLEGFERRHRIYDVFAFPEFLEDKEFNYVVSAWKDKVRKKTNLLALFDQLGIRIFCEDLENQPAFPGVRIEFGSREILERKVKKMEHIGGLAYRDSKLIKVLSTKTPFRVQMGYFLKTGEIDSTTSTVVHELIHHKHYDLDSGVDWILTEVQAHFSSIFQFGTSFTPSKVVADLTHSHGVYKFDKNKVKGAVRAMAILLGMGMDYSRVTQIVADSRYDTKEHRYLPLEEKAKNVLKKFSLDSLDENALDLLYRMYATNQRLKARILLYETIGEEFGLEKLKRAKESVLQGRLLSSLHQYGDDGNPDEKHGDLFQRSICPTNDEFPYDITGRRTGITFGLVVRDDKYSFRIGRFEARGTNETLTWANSEGEINYLLGIVKKQSTKINFGEKLNLFESYLEMGQVNASTMELFSALNNEDDMKKIVDVVTENMKGIFTLVLEELESLNKYPDWRLASENEKKIKAYLMWVETYDNLVDILGVLSVALKNTVQPTADKIKKILISVPKPV